MTTEQNIQSLLPERDFVQNSRVADKALKAQQEVLDDLHERERSKKARVLQRKAKYYKTKYGDTFEPEFDEDGNLIDPQYALPKIKKALVDDDTGAVVVQKPLIPEEATDVMLVGDYAHLNGTTRPQIAHLLKRLNIDQTVQLTKADMRDLLTTLMMCNERQLKAMQNNKKVPVAIRIIIKALEIDIKTGNLDTVEKLWDRIFGKPTQTSVVEDTSPVSALQSIVPGLDTSKPISREAYVMIKERLIDE